MRNLAVVSIVNGAALDPFVSRAIAPGDAVQLGAASLSVRPGRS